MFWSIFILGVTTIKGQISAGMVKENQSRDRILKRLCNKYNCDISQLPDRVQYLGRGTRVRLNQVLGAKNVYEGQICKR